jgi:hypothetical protein
MAINFPRCFVTNGNSLDWGGYFGQRWHASIHARCRNQHAGALALDLNDDNQRHRVLTHGPIGGWRTLPGTHTALLVGQIHFGADGQGGLVSSSLMQGEQRFSFRWRMAASGAIECQPQDDPPQLDAYGQAEIEDWHRIRFELARMDSDIGRYWVLRETGTDGFWELPMALVPMD